MKYRNFYIDEPPNFAELAENYPSLKPFVDNQSRINFKDPAALREVTKCLLKKDFKIDIFLHEERLCPPIPNRFAYILWIQELIDFVSYNQEEQKVLAFDIGTGSTCIYPLLGCSQRPNWFFYATDIDKFSLELAQKNVTRNGLDNRIKIIDSTKYLTLIPLDELNISNIKFCMCNPPFYTSKEEMIASSQQKSKKPFSSCTGSLTEMVTPGGEVGFVKKIIKESYFLKERVNWYTSMLGKLSSVIKIIELFREMQIDNYVLSELPVGGNTRRWVVGWSFMDIRAPNHYVRPLAKSLIHLSSSLTMVDIKLDIRTEILKQKITYIMNKFNINFVWDNEYIGNGETPGNIWSRSARRQNSKITTENSYINFKFRLEIMSKNNTKNAVSLKIIWIKGIDKIIFESFYSMLRRELKTLNTSHNLFTQT
ncbi:unnamed protein product [Pneumocystis jirovecii]|uniref:U6 small nuclear RNA (adenine-(43)-N(6))-methyltransferase n=2 Tax=Pneumocystis jirovecii TaxID=42068 RepID=L0P7L9_PNEJI|nr:uncharacterized protein T551_00699 [Pneumocystis jirovecii RU7]KTW32017.1 hypothetical protein T551_00699 [Pneumocystis jirovecii RU7]CCJ28371.1 unnamed protein product [Pneumocystis jirovecii]